MALFSFLLGFACCAAMCWMLLWWYGSVMAAKYVRKQKHEMALELQHADAPTLRRVLGEENLPAWTKLPDYERVQWMNTVLRQLWPYLNSAISAAAREALAPILQENKPVWISKIELHRFTCGQRPPEVSSAKVYQNPGDISIVDAIIIELDYVWDSDLDIHIVVHPLPKQTLIAPKVVDYLSQHVRVKVGIQDANVNGRMRLVFRPLTNKLPCIGAMQVSLVDMPEFDFSLTLYGGDVSFIPGLESWLYTLARDRLFRSYMVPEKYVINFQGDESLEYLPQALLEVCIVEATHVPKCDWLTYSDCIARVYVRESEQMNTMVKSNTRHPKWDETFTLSVVEPPVQTLCIVLEDYDFFGNEEIGRIEMPVSRLEGAGGWQEFNELIRRPGNNSKHQAAGAFNVADLSIMQGVKTAGKAVKKTHDWLKGIGAFNSRTCKIRFKVNYTPLDKQEVKTVAQARAYGKPLDESRLSPVMQRVVKGGTLSVLVKGCSRLAKKPLLKGSLLGSSIVVEVKVGHQTKKSPAADFGENGEVNIMSMIEFVVGPESDGQQGEHRQVVVEVWDKKFKNDFKGRMSIPLSDVTSKGSVSGSYRLRDAPKGKIDLEFTWRSAV